MGKPIIWSGSNAKLINSGDLVDRNDLSLTNGDKITVTQASHGFTSSDVGRPLYLNGTTWTLAKADTAATAEVAGFIYAVLDSNTLRISTSGEIPTVGANFLEGGGSLTAGEAYFLSATTAGKVTATEPTNIGLVSKPLGVAKSTTSFQFFNFRGMSIGSTNARTQISLSNNTTATIQNMSSYDAGEIVGWVYIDATTDYRFYVSAQFAKNGAGSNYNLSYQTVGDTPPAGFSITITSGGVIQYTMPNVTGFSSAIFNYALNAPAVGTAFPLSVSGTNVVGGTPTVDTINEYTSTNGVQIKGRTSSTTSLTGYFGEEIKAISSSSVTVNSTPAYNTWYDITGLSITLTAGVWDLSAMGSFTMGTNSATWGSQNISFNLAVRDSSNNIIYNGWSASSASPNWGTRMIITLTPYRVQITSSTTYKLSLRVGDDYGTTTLGALFARGDLGFLSIRALRVA